MLKSQNLSKDGRFLKVDYRSKAHNEREREKRERERNRKKLTFPAGRHGVVRFLSVFFFLVARWNLDERGHSPMMFCSLQISNAVSFSQSFKISKKKNRTSPFERKTRKFSLSLFLRETRSESSIAWWWSNEDDSLISKGREASRCK